MKFSLYFTFFLFWMCSCSSAVHLEREKAVRLDQDSDRQSLIVEAAKIFGPQSFYEARYNPTPCPCPPFELRVDDRWVRVVLVFSDEDSPVVNKLIEDAQKLANDGTAPSFYFVGALEYDRIQQTVTGFPVMEFEFNAYSREKPVETSDEE